MWLVPGTITVPIELLDEVRLCAYLIVLHHRRDGRDPVDEADLRREACIRLRNSLREFTTSEWGQETVMACFQRATDIALAYDMAPCRMFARLIFEASQPRRTSNSWSLRSRSGAAHTRHRVSRTRCHMVSSY